MIRFLGKESFSKAFCLALAFIILSSIISPKQSTASEVGDITVQSSM